MPTTRRPPMTPAERADIVASFRAGVSLCEISRRTGRDRTTIYKVVTRAGCVVVATGANEPSESTLADPEPTQTQPGTAARQAVYRERIAAGERLHHPKDARGKE